MMLGPGSQLLASIVSSADRDGSSDCDGWTAYELTSGQGGTGGKG